MPQNKYNVNVTQRPDSISTGSSYSEPSSCYSDAGSTGSNASHRPRTNRNGGIVVVSHYSNDVYGSGTASRRDMVETRDSRRA